MDVPARREGPWKHRRVVRPWFVLHGELVVQIDCRGKDLSRRLALVAHRVPALPAERVLLFDLRSAFSTCSDTRRFFLRAAITGGSERRLGFFALRDWRLAAAALPLQVVVVRGGATGFFFGCSLITSRIPVATRVQPLSRELPQTRAERSARRPHPDSGSDNSPGRTRKSHASLRTSTRAAERIGWS